MNNAERACFFEALLCRVHRHSAMILGMKAENQQCEYLGQPMAHQGDAFRIEAEKYEDFAWQFEELSKR